MDIDYQKMFYNLAELLKDICQFLSSDRLDILSHRDKKLVETLVNRSKVQLQEIAKAEVLCAPEDYVDMDANKVTKDKEEPLEIYSCVEETNRTIDTTITQEQSPCPYLDLPAKKASQNVKCGDLSMKRRFLLGFEKFKRVYGSIHNGWLLIYNTDTNIKPCFTINLKYYEAKSDESKNTNFELTNTALHQKGYSFMALTFKDKLQWMVQINRTHGNAAIQNKGFELQENTENTKFDKDNDTTLPKFIDDPEIYFEIEDIKLSLSKNMNLQKNSGDDQSRPPLPGRFQQGQRARASTNTETSNNSSLQSSEESLTYEIPDLKKVNMVGKNDSDVEEGIYEKVVNLKSSIAKTSTPIEKEDLTETKKVAEASTVLIDSDSKQNKIKPYQRTAENYNHSTVNEKRNNSFVHELTKRTNSPIKKNSSVASNVEIRNKVSSTDPRVTVAAPLIPPEISKVPVVLLKPKVRDRPGIGSRSALSSFRQIEDVH